MSARGRSRPTVAVQLREEIRTLIAELGLVAGDRVPSEAELVDRFSVSRPSLREALKLLEEDGTLLAVHGRGRFVSGRAMLSVERPITHFESVGAMAAACGYSLSSRVVGFETVPATERRAAMLGVEDGAPLLAVARIRGHEGRDLVYSLDLIACEGLGAIGEAADWADSVNSALVLRGIEPVMARAAASATHLPTEAAAKHGLEDFGPALLIEETAYTATGRAVLHSLVYHRGDAFRFSFARTPNAR
ncbi:GntR family transcriptional regulator [Pelagibacterium montanilacus]|uniref:GntR family transcriptional regulator n=1 Tax=Pelagibacterium montanilacus TaxID=2185280 RepID=UPI0013DFD7D8|nr:GntR family transcriptional regulator [Pelagibacterium montanilacus]